MEPIAQLKQTRTHFQFGSPALTPFTLPRVSEAVQSHVARAFMEERGYLVDMKGHSGFCLEAYQGGLLQDHDLEQLHLYPNGYGLHLITERAVARSAARLSIVAKEAIPDAAQRVDSLSQPFVDVPFAAGATIACIQQGLLHESDVAGLIAKGTECGYALIKECEKALGSLLPDESRKARVVRDGGVVEHPVVRGTGIYGNDFCLLAWNLDDIHLQLPECIEGSFLEVNVLLFKTLDAMSHYLVPFHTPSSWMGVHGQNSYTIGEAYEVLKDRIKTSTREELIEYFVDFDFNQATFESYAFDLEGEGPHDEEMVERMVALLLDMHDIEQNFAYRLDYSNGTTEQSRKAEMVEMLSQATQLIERASPYTPVLTAICNALRICIDLADQHFRFSEHDLNGTATEGTGFFESICVVVDGRHSMLFDDAFNSWNASAENFAELYVGLPLGDEELVAQVTVPIIQRTHQCLTLLRQIEISLEEVTHAEQ